MGKNNGRGRRARAPLRAVAYHEAGHAVMALVEGIPICSVSVMPRGHPRGVTLQRGFRPDRDASPWAPISAMQHVRFGFAGRLAEERACPGSTSGHWADTKQAASILARICFSPEELGAYWHLLEIQTKWVLSLPRVWPCVEAVAEALMVRGRLSGADVETIMARVTAEPRQPTPEGPDRRLALVGIAHLDGAKGQDPAGGNGGGSEPGPDG